MRKIQPRNEPDGTDGPLAAAAVFMAAMVAVWFFIAYYLPQIYQGLIRFPY